MTRYVFIGAGAIGSAVGGLLAEQGVRVLLVARGHHGAAMIENGLTVRCPDTTVPVTPPTVTGPEDVRLGPDDVLVLTTKTQQADAALDQWADVGVYEGDHRVGRAADLLPVLTALNGVASEEIALRYFTRVYAVCVWFPAVLLDPGEVIVRSAPPRGVFHVGRYPRSDDPGDADLFRRLSDDWGAAGIQITTPEAVMDWKYRKLISNLGNVLQALLGDGGAASDLREAVETEARAVLGAANIAVSSDAEIAGGPGAELVMQPVPGEPEQLGGSTWQSLVRGTGTVETDYLNGEIALIARRHGLSAPINTRLTTLARRAAATGQRPGAISAAELRTELGL